MFGIEGQVVEAFKLLDETREKDMLVQMAIKLKLEGYTLDINDVLLDVDEEEKESSLFRHSEKLAVSFDLQCFLPSNCAARSTLFYF